MSRSLVGAHPTAIGRKKAGNRKNTASPGAGIVEHRPVRYIGIDPENTAMTNVSVWGTRADAERMRTVKRCLIWLKVLLMPGSVFEIPITHYERLWTI